MKDLSNFTRDQRSAVDFLLNLQAGIVWGDVGTGKSSVALTALKKLFDSFSASKVLVTGPRLVASQVWSAEVEEWAHLRGLKVQPIIGTAKQRLAALEKSADIHTISRDNVCWLEKQFIRVTGANAKGVPTRAQYRQWPWDSVVLDESQSYMSQSSKRFKSMRRLRRLFSRLYLLTGSFMPNGYGCAWSQLYLVDGGKRLGLSESAFKRRWFRREVNDGIPSFEVLPNAAEEIDRLIADVCFVMKDKKQVKPHNIIRVSLDKEERKLYSKMMRDRVLEFGNREVNAVNAGVLWGKLLQLANGAVYDADREVHLVHNKKIEALVELMESLPEKVLIGYSFVHDLDRIQAALKKAGVKGVGVIRTQKSLEDWTAGRITKGIIHPASAGHGINTLKDAAAIVWFGMTPNFEHFQQLNGRVIGGHRLQGRDIGIHILVTQDTVDEDAVQMIDFKGQQQSTAQVRVAKEYLKEVMGGKKDVPSGHPCEGIYP